LVIKQGYELGGSELKYHKWEEIFLSFYTVINGYHNPWQQ